MAEPPQILHLRLSRPCSQIHRRAASSYMRGLGARTHRWWSRNKACMCFFDGHARSLRSEAALHLLLSRPCSQIEEPWQILRRLFRRPFSQMAEPPQLLHELLYRPCLLMEEPPQRLHELLRRLCSQMPPPPPPPPGSWNRLYWRLLGHLLRVRCILRSAS